MERGESAPTAIVVMGPSGVGKTTVGRLLAAELGWTFCDADDLHPPANVDKMRGGEGLSEQDRAPWLQRVREAIDEHIAAEKSLVMACSALRRSHRHALGLGHPQVSFVLLDAPQALLQSRLEARRGHFMPASLLPSQLATFEQSEDVIVADAGPPPVDIVAAIRARLSLPAAVDKKTGG